MYYPTTSSITVLPTSVKRSFATGPGAGGSSSPGTALTVPARPGLSAGSHHLGVLQGLGTVESSPPQEYVTLEDSDDDERQVFTPSRSWADTRVSTADVPLPQQARRQVRQLFATLDQLERSESLAIGARLQKGLQDRGLSLTDRQLNGPAGRSVRRESPEPPRSPEPPSVLMLPPKKKYRMEVAQRQAAAQAPVQPERSSPALEQLAPGRTSPAPTAFRLLSRHDAVEATGAVQQPAAVQAPAAQTPAASSFAGPGWETAMQRYEAPTPEMSIHQRETVTILNARAATLFSIQVIKQCMPTGTGNATVQALLRSDILKGAPDGRLVRTAKQVRLEEVMKAIEYEGVMQLVTQVASGTEAGRPLERNAAQAPSDRAQIAARIPADEALRHMAAADAAVGEEQAGGSRPQPAGRTAAARAPGRRRRGR